MPLLSGLTLVVLTAGPVPAQALFVCENGGRAFVVAGEDGAPGCNRIADASRDLQLAPAQPDLDAIARRLADQGARIDHLERLLIGSRSRGATRPPLRPSADTFDTRGRTRDLGQDIDRALDDISR